MSNIDYPFEIATLRAEVERLQTTCAELTTDGNAITLASNLAKVSIENQQLKEQLADTQQQLELVLTVLKDVQPRFNELFNYLREQEGDAWSQDFTECQKAIAAVLKGTPSTVTGMVHVDGELVKAMETAIKNCRGPVYYATIADKKDTDWSAAYKETESVLKMLTTARASSTEKQSPRQ